ncbi:hypothetical protein Gotur_025045 [Gossypium turneri]
MCYVELIYKCTTTNNLEKGNNYQGCEDDASWMRWMSWLHNRNR